MNKWIALALFLLLCLGVAIAEGIATHHGVNNWYQTLVKPEGTPPNWVFPVVWTILYTMMAVSVWLIWLAPSGRKLTAYTLFAVQLFFNFLWSWLFFFYENPALALIDISLLWVAIIATMMAFYRHSHLAAGLLIPYLLWVSYAVHLNVMIWVFNS